MRGIITRSERLLDSRSIELAPDGGYSWTRKIISQSIFSLAAAAFTLIAATAQTQDAVANGDTRTLSFYHTHTRESATVTFRRNGRYDEQALAQLNWFLRDWRVDKSTQMDPRLFDILWEVYREAGSSQPINIISAYRSPETNGALRRRSRGVAESSQHMLGKAMDIRLPDVDTARLRAIAMRMQYGGVGYYPSSAFVHVDTASVRAWPRMTREQLVKLFPDGKTLHLPSNGKPLGGYEQAKAEIPARNAALAAQASAGGGSIGTVLTNLFGRKNTAPARETEVAAAGATTLAYAAVPESPEALQAPAPLPPPRPQALALPEIDILPEPAPSKPIVSAALPVESIVPKPEMVTLGYDPKAAVQALFEPRTHFLDVGFSPRTDDELSATRFTGPAVKPLPVIDQVQANLRG